jgi:hypothetical protein
MYCTACTVAHVFVLQVEGASAIVTTIIALHVVGAISLHGHATNEEGDGTCTVLHALASLSSTSCSSGRRLSYCTIVTTILHTADS